MRREVKAPSRTIRPRERKPTERPGRRIPSLAKTTPPVIAGAYRRKRLFGLLDRARRRCRAVWIASPAGAGKTTPIEGATERGSTEPGRRAA